MSAIVNRDIYGTWNVFVLLLVKFISLKEILIYKTKMLRQTLFYIYICFLNGLGSSLLPSSGSVRSDNLALLTSTLRTYQKASCDGEYVVLRCPLGTTISVQLAQYGKTAPSLGLCSTATNTHPELMDIVDGYTNVTCHWPSAIQTVVGLCQKKTSCKFQTSPCPGARKYVEIGFKCRPSEFKSVIGCDSEVIQLKCNRSSRLAIYSANYGRTEYEGVQCPQPKGVPEESCLSSFATETVMQMCHGKRRCALGVNTATFGSPCKPESKMYLKVVYTCVPRKVLKDKFQGELEQDEMFDDETEYESGDAVGGVLEQPSIYFPDHSKGRANPKSTVRPSFPSKISSSQGNQETIWLYVTLAVATMLVVLMLVILVKIFVQRHKDLQRRGANAALTAASSSAGPIASTMLNDIDELTCVMDGVTEPASNSSQQDHPDNPYHSDQQTQSFTNVHLSTSGGDSNCKPSIQHSQILLTDFSNKNQCALLLGGEGGLVNPSGSGSSGSLGRECYHRHPSSPCTSMDSFAGGPHYSLQQHQHQPKTVNPPSPGSIFYPT